MQLFENKTRFIEPRQIKIGESVFNFLDRTGRDGAEQARNWLNKHFESLDTECVSNFLRRLKAPNKSTATAAFFELITYGILRDHGLSPTLVFDKVQNNPDIELTHEEFGTYWIECTIVEIPKSDAAIDSAIHALMTSTAKALGGKAPWRLNISEIETTKTTPSGKAFAAFLMEVKHIDFGQDHIWNDPISEWTIEFAFIELDEERPCESINGIGPSHCCYPDALFLERARQKLKDKRYQHKSRADRVILCLGWNDENSQQTPSEALSLLQQIQSSPSELLWIPHALPWNAHVCNATLLLKNDQHPFSTIWNGDRVLLQD